MPAEFREKRTARRSRVFFGGEIRVGAGHAPIECHVKNISKGGAGIETPCVDLLPDRFELVIRKTNQRHQAVVTWSEGRRRGIAYRPHADRSWASPAVLRLVPTTEPDK